MWDITTDGERSILRTHASSRLNKRPRKGLFSLFLVREFSRI